MIPKVTGWYQIPAGPHDGSSIMFRPGGIIRVSFQHGCFPPARVPSLLWDSLPGGASFRPAGQAAHKLPITVWWKVLGGKHMGNCKSSTSFSGLESKTPRSSSVLNFLLGPQGLPIAVPSLSTAGLSLRVQANSSLVHGTEGSFLGKSKWL